MATSEKEDAMRQHIECSVCFLPYNTSTKRPKNLSCGHTFCAECLNQLYNVQTSTITCPQDRKQCPVPLGDVDKLGNNFMTLNLLENYCDECQNQLEEQPCFSDHCLKVLCRSCRVNHCESFHSMVKASLLELKQEASRLLVLSDDDVELTQMLEEADRVVAEVTRVCDDLKKKIIDKVMRNVEKETDKFVEWKTTLGQETLIARSFVDKTVPRLGSSYKATKSDEALVDAYQQAVKKRDELLEQERAHPEFLTFDVEALHEEFEDLTAKLLQSILPGSVFKPSAESGDASSSTDSCQPDETIVELNYTKTSYKACVGQKGAGAKEFDLPIAICTSPMGYIAVTDHNNHRVHILKESLEHVTVFGHEGTGDNQYMRPQGITLNKDDLLFISDTNNHRIQVTNVTGKFLRMFGSKGSGPSELQSPVEITSSGDLLYICDSSNYRVKVTREDGSYVRVIGSKGTGPGHFSHKPYYVAVCEAQDKVAVSDGEGNLHFFSCAGTFIRTLRNEAPNNIDATGLAFDKHGHLIVTDFKGNRIVVLDKDDQILASVGTRGNGPGQFKGPYGVAMTTSGDIVVCDKDNHRIQLFQVPHA